MFKGMDPSLKYTFYGIFTIFLGLFIATYHTLTIAFTNNEGVMNKNYYEIYELLKPKILRNKKRLLDIYENDETCPYIPFYLKYRDLQ